MAKVGKISNLTPQQMIAIPVLAKGARDEEAGKAAGVSRQTVNTWRLYDPEFIQELRRQCNITSEAILATYVDTMKEMTGYALDAVMGACKAGDVSTAKWVLDKATTLPEACTAAYRDITGKPVIQSECVDSIIKEVAEREVNDYLENDSDSLNFFRKEEMLVDATNSLKAKHSNLYEQ